MKEKYPEGVWKGKTHSQESKLKISISRRGKQTTSTLGKHWYTDGKQNIIAFTCPDGFRRGRI